MPSTRRPLMRIVRARRPSAVSTRALTNVIGVDHIIRLRSAPARRPYDEHRGMLRHLGHHRLLPSGDTQAGGDAGAAMFLERMPVGGDGVLTAGGRKGPRPPCSLADRVHYRIHDAAAW